MGWRVALALVFAVAGAAPVSGQEDGTSPLRAWVDLGLVSGIASGVDVDLGAVVQVTLEKGKHHAALRFVGLGSVVRSSGDIAGDVALLYGRTGSAAFVHGAVGAGPAFVQLDGCDGVRGADCRTIGLTATAEAALQAKVVGLGVQAFGNLNSVASYGGVGIVLQLGWMP